MPDTEHIITIIGGRLAERRKDAFARFWSAVNDELRSRGRAELHFRAAFALWQEIMTRAEGVEV